MFLFHWLIFMIGYQPSIGSFFLGWSYASIRSMIQVLLRALNGFAKVHVWSGTSGWLGCLLAVLWRSAGTCWAPKLWLLLAPRSGRNRFKIIWEPLRSYGSSQGSQGMTRLKPRKSSIPPRTFGSASSGMWFSIWHSRLQQSLKGPGGPGRLGTGRCCQASCHRPPVTSLSLWGVMNLVILLWLDSSATGDPGVSGVFGISGDGLSSQECGHQRGAHEWIVTVLRKSVRQVHLSCENDAHM